MRVDVVASQPHYLEHVLPVWEALPDEHRGRLVTWGDAGDSGEDPGERGDIVLAASWWDVRGVHGRYKKRALMEHGVGQTYNVDGFQDPAYAGAPGRELVNLFLCPNERVASLNRAANPYATSVVIGTPKMDKVFAGLRLLNPPGHHVAVTCHWDCKVCPETRGATDWVAPGVAGLLKAGYVAVASSHPRAREEVLRNCVGVGVKYESQPDVEVLCVDNSSAMYEHLARNRPVVLLEPPWFRRDVQHGMRFWEHADVGPACHDPSALPEAVDLALQGWADRSSRVEEVIREVYPVRDGTSATRAVEALVNL